MTSLLMLNWIELNWVGWSLPRSFTMKKLMIALVALTAVWTVGCEEATQQEDPWELKCVEDCEENTDRPKVEGTYISGHLGNYDSCPEDGYTTEGSASGASTSGDADAAPCREGDDCSWEMACEDAQLTVKLSNIGNEKARGLQVTTIELFDADGVSRAVLPLIDAVDTSTNTPFDGTLADGQDVTLRVGFQGPQNPYMLLQTEPDSSGGMDRSAGGYGTIELTVSADNHDDVIIVSSELYAVPSVDT
jgi:hypothetical protein